MVAEPDTRIGLATGDKMRGWDAYVAANPRASVYHLAAWRDIIQRVFRQETHYLTAESSTGVTGVLPLVRLKSLAFGDFLVSLPYLSYGGVLADDSTTARAMISHASELARDLRVRHMEFRHAEDCCDLPRRTDKVSMELALNDSSSELWKRLGAKKRAQIKRPKKEGATTDAGGPEFLNDFYSVFGLKYRDLGVPVYPIEWFRAVLETFPDQTKVFVVRVGRVPVAASIVIGHGARLEVPWAASLRAADRYGVNMLLYWTMLEYAIDNGYSIFDFGRSTQGSGTWRFKKQWGAEPRQLYWHYWMRNPGELPVLNTSNPKYQAAVAVWQRLPLWLTNRLGPRIVRNLP